MPGALAARRIDAYFVGEPHAAQRRAGRHRPRALLREGHLAALHLVRAGGHREADRASGRRWCATWSAASPRAASGRRRIAWTPRRSSSPYFRQDEKLVRYVLTQPPDRVSYRMLTPERRGDAADRRHGARGRASSSGTSTSAVSSIASSSRPISRRRRSTCSSGSRARLQSGHPNGRTKVRPSCGSPGRPGVPIPIHHSSTHSTVRCARRRSGCALRAAGGQRRSSTAVLT